MTNQARHSWNVAATLLAIWLATSAGVTASEAPRANLVPWPRQIELGSGDLPLSEQTRIVAAQPELAPLAKVLADEIADTTGWKLTTTGEAARAGDLVLTFDTAIKGEAYRLDVTDRAVVVAGNYRAAAYGAATLLQAIEQRGNLWTVPQMKVSDQPTAEFRGLMVDVARKPHSIELLKYLIRLSHFYKLNYFQLHLTDAEAFTFPSTAYPKLATAKHSYTLDELRDLVDYAAERGIAIIPELEVPGHAGAFVRGMPELFGAADEHGKQRNLGGCLNLVNEAVYPALETIVREMIEVFHTSPYFHIGADEVYLAEIKKIPEWATYKAKHGLETDHDVYYDCIVRMHEIVKRQGKQTLVWEGFNDRGNVKIPKDVIVMVFENAYFPANVASAAGYTLINTSWQPIYVVNRKKWPAKDIYAWNYRRWKKVFDTTPPEQGTQLPPDAPVLGAMMCAWEQAESIELATLRPRVSAMSERVWNPSADRGWDDFARRASAADQALAKRVSPISISCKGLCATVNEPPNVNYFEKPLTVSLASLAEGEIRYTLAGKHPARDSELYQGPFTLDHSATVKARLFDLDGSPRGFFDWTQYERITPALRYTYYKSPPSGTDEFPDFSLLTPTSTGMIDTFRSFGLDRKYAVVMEGAIEVPVDGVYEFTVRLHASRGKLTIGNVTVCDFDQTTAGKPWWEPAEFTANLKAGKHALNWTYITAVESGFVEIKWQPPGETRQLPLKLAPLNAAD